MMDRLLEWLTAPLPRVVRLVVLPVLGFWLVLLFVFLGFPYDVLADRAIGALERGTGAVIRYGEVEPRLTIGGPGFRFHEVDVRTSDGRRYRVDPLSVRPAWSTSWLGGSPHLRTFLVSDQGSLAGFVTLGRTLGWDGRIVDLDLAALPLGDVAQGVRVSGRADVDADLRITDGVAEGEIELAARSGEVLHPMIPLPIEFEKVAGRLTLGGDALARIESFTLDGPLFGATASGTIGQADDPMRAPVDLAIGLDVREPGMRSMARNLGLELDSNGHADLDVSGTVARPEIR